MVISVSFIILATMVKATIEGLNNEVRKMELLNEC